MFGLKPEEIQLIQSVFQRYSEVKEAVLFGSRSMGNYKPGSDIDIALKGRITPDTVLSISAELNERIPLPYKFDIVDYASISHQPLREHIDSYGKLFYKK